jgi:hypothetical protein
MLENSYDIYQLREDDSTRYFRYTSTKHLKAMGLSIQKEKYDFVYHAPLKESDTLDGIFEKFNVYRPEDFHGHSLSVSDIIVFHKDGLDKAYYVDDFGFAEVPEFIQEQQEQKQENLLTMESSGISVKQYMGIWHPVETQEIDGKNFFLLEHDTYGKEAASVIVDEKGVLYAQEVYDGFSEDIVNLIRTTLAQVKVMPDESVTIQMMEAYGYNSVGMLPVGADKANEYFKKGNMTLFALHPDGTETEVKNEKQLQRHIEMKGLFAVDKQDWMKYVQKKLEERVKIKEKPSLLGRLREKQKMLIKAENKDSMMQKKNEEQKIL